MSVAPAAFSLGRLQLFLLVHSLAANTFFVTMGALTAVFQQLPHLTEAENPFSPAEVGAFVGITNSIGYGLQFAFPRRSSRIFFGHELSDEAFLSWRALTLCGFMVYLLPLTLPLTWQLFSWLLFFGPMVNLLMYLTTNLASFHTHPLHIAMCLLTPYAASLPICLVDARGL